MTTKFEFEIKNLECANCANKIEVALNKETYIKGAQLNFMLKKLMIQTVEKMDEEEVRAKAEGLADQIEKGVKLTHKQAKKEQVERSKKTNYLLTNC